MTLVFPFHTAIYAALLGILAAVLTTEGFDVLDLKEAKVLLDELAPFEAA